MERLIDMEDRHLCLLRKLLSDHLANKTVWAYGSRAKWNAKQSSDLDLVVWDASTTQITEAIDAFSESNLPFTVQLFAWEKTPKDFQEDIRKKHVVLQEGSKIPEGWREAKLGDVAVFNYGKSLLEQKRLSGDIPVFSSAGLIGWHNEPLVKERGIVIGRKGTIGSVHKSDIPFFPIDTAFYISESDTECNLNFLYYLLRELRLDKLNSDSAVPGLNRNTAYAQDIKIPSLPEQKAIAEVLSSLDDKINLLHRQNKTLENIAQTLFQKWFIEDAGEEWEEKPLSDVLDFLEGPGIRNWQYTERGTRFINIRLIQDSEIDIKKSNFISDEEANGKYKHFLLQEKDMIVSTSGTLGKTAIVRSYHLPLMLNTSIIRFRPKDDVNYSFMYQYLRSREFKGELESLGSGSVQKNFGPTHLKMMKMKVPTKEILNDFRYHADSLYSKLSKNCTQIRALKIFRDVLLSKLMNGEASVINEGIKRT